MKSGKTKDYFSTTELLKEPWFPVKSAITLKKLIEQGELEAVNVSTSPEFKRYRISKESALNFVKRRTIK